MLLIPAHRTLRQEVHEFLGYTVRPCSENIIKEEKRKAKKPKPIQKDSETQREIKVSLNLAD
jgi:hypothetical protein